MLKSLLTPLLLALCVGSGGYYYNSSQAAQPVSVVAVATAVPTGTSLPQTQIDVPPPVPPASLPDVDAVVVIDNSGSMFGYTCINRTPRAANDPQNLRVQGAQVVVTSLAADLEPRQTNLAIITFGDTVTKVRELTQLSNNDPSIRDDLVAAVENPACQGDTNIAGAIQAASEELKSPRAKPGNLPAIIFLTDGAPTVGGGFPEIDQLLAGLEGVQFFAVLLGQDAELADSKQFWRDQQERRPNVVVEELLSPDGLPDLYRSITRRLNQVPDLADVSSLPPGQQVQVQVPPNVRQMVITILKRSPSISLTIQDPSGTDARTLPSDRFRALVSRSPVEAFVVGRPQAGDWLFSVPDGETITVLRPEYKSVYQVQLLKPDSAGMLSVDLPTNLVAQVVDIDSQQPISDTFTLTGSYHQFEQPEDAATPFAFQSGQIAPQFDAVLAAGTFIENDQYLFSLEVEDSNGLRAQPSIYQLAAGRLPVISKMVVVPTRAFVDEPVALTVTVGNADAAAGTPALRLMQALPGGATALFNSVDATTYNARLPALGQPGTYNLTVAYAGKTTGGRDFNATTSAQLTVVERPLTIWLRWLALALATLIGTFLGFRYLLLAPLIPLFQRLGISPRGYVRLTMPGMNYPQPETSMTALLRRARKLRSLTIGVGSKYDLPLEEDPNAPPPDPDAPPPRRTLRERLWGPVPKGYIRRQGSDTVIESPGNGKATFSKSIKDIVVEQNRVEVSLEPIDNNGTISY